MSIAEATVQRHRRLGQGRINPQRRHAQRRLKQIIIALGLRLGLDPVLPPDIHPMPPHQHSIGLWVLLNGFAQAPCSTMPLKRSSSCSAVHECVGSSLLTLELSCSHDSQVRMPAHEGAKIGIMNSRSQAMATTTSSPVNSHSLAVFSMMGTMQLP